MILFPGSIHFILCCYALNSKRVSCIAPVKEVPFSISAKKVPYYYRSSAELYLELCQKEERERREEGKRVRSKDKEMKESKSTFTMPMFFPFVS